MFWIALFAVLRLLALVPVALVIWGAIAINSATVYLFAAMIVALWLHAWWQAFDD